LDVYFAHHLQRQSLRFRLHWQTLRPFRRASTVATAVASRRSHQSEKRIELFEDTTPHLCTCYSTRLKLEMVSSLLLLQSYCTYLQVGFSSYSQPGTLFPSGSDLQWKQRAGTLLGWQTWPILFWNSFSLRSVLNLLESKSIINQGMKLQFSFVYW